MKPFQYEHPVMQAITKVVMMLWLNVLWIIGCLPVITIGASCGGYYFATEKYICHDHGYAAGQFWRGFKSCFKQNTLLGLAVLAVEAVLFSSVYLYRQMGERGYAVGAFGVVIMILMALLALYAFYLFCYLARFESPMKNALENVLILFFRHLGSTILLTGVLVLTLFLVYISPVLVFFIPALGMFAVNRILEPVFRRYMSPEQLAREEEINSPPPPDA